MREKIVKAEKGVIRVSTRIKNGFIEDIEISGDFFLYPEESLWILENYLKGIKFDKEEIEKAIKNFFKKNKVKAPLVKIGDLVNAIIGN